MRRNLKIIIALTLIFILFILKVVLSIETDIQDKKFIIKPGDDFLSIANNLKKENIIKDKNFFILYAYFTGDYHKIKPGEFIFNGKYNLSQILTKLKNNFGIAVTIPEGFNIFQVENELIKQGIIKDRFSLVNYKITNLKNDFDKYPFLKHVNLENNLEGFLYPNTYYFLKDTNIKDVIYVFLDNFNENIYMKTQNEIGEKDIYQKLILASLTEKEAYFKEDIPEILSVIYNRIERDMPLQIDATLCYIKMRAKYLNSESIDCGKLTNGDKNLKSSFNTYMNKGMILTPICNVNYETFKLTLSKMITNYLYYITDPETKITIFAKTLEEHNKNIQKYLK